MKSHINAQGWPTDAPALALIDVWTVEDAYEDDYEDEEAVARLPFAEAVTQLQIALDRRDLCAFVLVLVRHHASNTHTQVVLNDVIELTTRLPMPHVKSLLEPFVQRLCELNVDSSGAVDAADYERMVRGFGGTLSKDDEELFRHLIFDMGGSGRLEGTLQDMLLELSLRRLVALGEPFNAEFLQCLSGYFEDAADVVAQLQGEWAAVKSDAAVSGDDKISSFVFPIK